MLCINNLIVKLNSFHLSINFEIHPETITAIIGPSGAGKSTLLDAISGFSSAESGTVFWGEKSLDSLAPSLRPITIVFQDNNLFPHLIVSHDPKELIGVCENVIIVAENEATGPYNLQNILMNPPKSLNEYL